MSDETMNLTEAASPAVTDVVAGATIISTNAEGHDISNEAYRYYTFKDGSTFRVNDPAMLYITENGSHRVIDKDGVCHRPERGYVGISWKQTDGKPFSF